MFNDLKLALTALRQPFALFVLFFSFAATLLLFSGAASLLQWTVSHSTLIEADWLRTAMSYAGGGMVLVLGWFLFPMTMTVIACLFLEPLANRIEGRHYPELPAPKPGDWMDAVILTIRTLWRTVAYNLIALPLYFIPVVNVATYLAVNARLLAHEYYYALALRHLTLPQADTLYAKERLNLFKSGLQLAVFFLIPGLNMLAPILATGLMLHRLEKRPNGPLRQALEEGAANRLP